MKSILCTSDCWWAHRTHALTWNRSKSVVKKRSSSLLNSHRISSVFFFSRFRQIAYCCHFNFDITHPIYSNRQRRINKRTHIQIKRVHGQQTNKKRKQFKSNRSPIIIWYIILNFQDRFTNWGEFYLLHWLLLLLLLFSLVSCICEGPIRTFSLCTKRFVCVCLCICACLNDTVYVYFCMLLSLWSVINSMRFAFVHP